MSHIVLSNASKQYLCAIGASSQIIKSAFFNNCERSDPCKTLQTKFSSVGTGILNFECVVLPPRSNNDAIPLYATTKTILRSAHKAADNVFHMKVFPVPLYPYRKNIPPLLFLTINIIISKKFLCSSRKIKI